MIDKSFDFIVDRLFPGDPVLKRMTQELKNKPEREETHDTIENTNSEQVLQRD